MLIGIRNLTFITGCIQHGNSIRKLRAVQPQKPWDLALLGLLMIGSIRLGVAHSTACEEASLGAQLVRSEYLPPTVVG
jgi:hypothetical protein